MKESTATHPIPTSFRLRRRKWTVLRAPKGKPAIFGGHADPTSKRIVIYDAARNRTRTPHEQQKTFWHESTHAVLMTMNHKLARDEAFVTQFGLLLEEMVRTARFEEGS
jgi:hypothetical protein